MCVCAASQSKRGARETDLHQIRIVTTLEFLISVASPRDQSLLDPRKMKIVSVFWGERVNRKREKNQGVLQAGKKYMEKKKGDSQERVQRDPETERTQRRLTSKVGH